MDQREKQGRFEAAAAILDVLKLHGCPMATAAKELDVSPTTVSHWRAVPSAHKRSVPIPSDNQLRGLLGLLMRRVAANLYALNTLLSGGYIGGEEFLKLLVLLTAQINDTQKRCAKQLTIMQQYGSLRSKTKGPTPTTEVDPVLFLLNAYSSSEWGPSVVLAEHGDDETGRTLTKLLRAAALPIPKRQSYFQDREDETQERVREMFEAWSSPRATRRPAGGRTRAVRRRKPA